MPIVWVDKKDLNDIIAKKIIKPRVVLDIGSGIMPQLYAKTSFQICCEPCMEYIQILQKKIKSIPDRVFLLLNISWEEAVKIFPPNSVDSIFLIDVIEHLEKTAAIQLLRMTEKIATKQIIIFTPLGFLPQNDDSENDAWGLHGITWQKHRSGWYPEDFGPGWEIFGSKEYHFTDIYGTPFKNPYGAFWAIKTMPPENNSVNPKNVQIKHSKRQTIHLVIDRILDFFI